MTKVQIKYTLKTNEKCIKKEIFGLKTKEKINFKLNNDVFHLSKDVFLKENNETILKIDLKNKNNSYYLKEYKKELTLDIEIKEYLFNENKYYIKYKLNDEEIELELIYGVVT